MTFRAKDEVRHLGRLRGEKGHLKAVRKACVPKLEVRTALWIGPKKYTSKHLLALSVTSGNNTY